MIEEQPIHAEDCAATEEGEECQPLGGLWDTPPGIWVHEAEGELGEDVPWCRIRERAFEMARSDEREADSGEE